MNYLEQDLEKSKLKVSLLEACIILYRELRAMGISHARAVLVSRTGSLFLLPNHQRTDEVQELAKQVVSAREKWSEYKVDSPLTNKE